MTDIFISYARSTEGQAKQIAEALKALGYGVWRDDELPAHRAYAEVIDERLAAAKAVVVIWSAEAAKSEWVQSEADTARTDHKLVQMTVDGAKLPRPFDRIQCADLTGWTGELDAPAWRKVVASIADLAGRPDAEATEAAPPAPALELPSKPSIAVMPFANLSGDPEQEYFADGMVEEIVGALSRFKSIFVIGSGSTLSFKGKAVSALDAGRQLGVRYVLEGSVRRASNRVRIAVKLVDAADGVQVWAQRFEDTLEDIFALQDTVALAVAGRIEPEIQQAETRRSSERPTADIGSYDLYLRALNPFRTFSKAGVLQALDLLNRAIELDPNHGLALQLAGNCHALIRNNGWSEDPEGHRLDCVALANRAVKAAGDDPVVLASAGNMLGRQDGDVAAGLALAERAVALNPGSPSVRTLVAHLWLYCGDSERAVEGFETALRLDPTGPNRPTRIGGIGTARFMQRRFAEAAGLWKEFTRLTDGPFGYAMLAAVLGHLGQIAAAPEALARYRSGSSRPVEELAGIYFHRPDHIRLFLDGIALAEGKRPPAGPA